MTQNLGICSQMLNHVLTEHISAFVGWEMISSQSCVCCFLLPGGTVDCVWWESPGRWSTCPAPCHQEHHRYSSYNRWRRAWPPLLGSAPSFTREHRLLSETATKSGAYGTRSPVNLLCYFRLQSRTQGNRSCPICISRRQWSLNSGGNTFPSLWISES